MIFFFQISTSSKLNSFIENFFLRYYKDYLHNVDREHQTTDDELVTKHELKVTYNVNNPTKDIELGTPTGLLTFKNIPGTDKNFYNFQLDNTHISRRAQILLATGITSKFCLL